MRREGCSTRAGERLCSRVRVAKPGEAAFSCSASMWRDRMRQGVRPGPDEKDWATQGGMRRR